MLVRICLNTYGYFLYLGLLLFKFVVCW
jgi:hypothetical protein